MRALKQLILFLALYLAFLAWRFPYDKTVERSITRFERATHSQVTYTMRGAGPNRVQLENVKIDSASGVKAEFGSATVSLIRGTAYLTQPGGYARLEMERDGTAILRMDKIQVASGSQELGNCRINNSEIRYNVLKREGSGDLGLQIPKFQAPLPIPEMNLEVGAKLTFAEKGPGHEIRAEVHLIGGTEFNADGNLLLEPQPSGLPARLTGTLSFKTPMKRGTLRVEGIWKKPQFVVVNNP